MRTIIANVSVVAIWQAFRRRKSRNFHHQPALAGRQNTLVIPGLESCVSNQWLPSCRGRGPFKNREYRMTIDPSSEDKPTQDLAAGNEGPAAQDSAVQDSPARQRGESDQCESKQCSTSQHGSSPAFQNCGADHIHSLPSDGSDPQQKTAASTVQALRDSEAQFRALVENNADGVVALHLNGVICYANPAAAEMLGCSRNELIGQTFSVPVAPDEVTEVNLLKRGCDLPSVAEMRVTSILWQGEPACLATLRDITERHNAALAAVSHRDHFLSVLSHELRNPLSAIGNASELLSTEECTSTQTDATNVIVRQVAQLSRLLDDLLNVARVTVGKIKLQTSCIDIREVLDATVEAVFPQIEQHRHQLKISLPEQPIFVDGDATRLQQIFANLLANAAKYTPAGGVITLALSSVDNACNVSVSDNGMGLCPTETDSIFEMFVQSDDTIDHSAGGLGLGLTLARDLVSLHNGKITAHSDGPGSGCEVRVELPAVKAAQIASEQPAKTSARKRILVVEDLDDNRNMLQRLLEFDGFTVETAADGKQALDAFRQSPPDIALMDIGLPELSGYQVARAIRRDEALNDVMLIALTGYGRRSDREATINAGFNAHMVKPFDLAEFHRLIESRQATS